MSNEIVSLALDRAVTTLAVVVGTLLLVVIVLCAVTTYCRGVKHGTELGRIDIASGRVIGERVTNADGLTEWRWKEAGK